MLLQAMDLTILKVTTFWKDILPALCCWTRCRYIKTGLLPVGNPRTKGFSGVGLKALMRSYASPLAEHVPKYGIGSKHQ